MECTSLLWMTVMDEIASRAGIDDFNQFCKSLDVRYVIAAVDEQGQAEGFEKEVYALAILRAVHNGDLGEDAEMTRNAIAAFWQHGHRKGFNAESFNEVFDQLFVYW